MNAFDIGINYWPARTGMRWWKHFSRDEVIADLLKMEGKETTTVIVSDHGFRGGIGRGVDAHKLDGVLIMAGKHVGKGEITGATVYDIAPTVLALLGLPPAEDMRGKVLWSALDATIPRDRFQRRVLVRAHAEPHIRGSAQANPHKGTGRGDGI